MKKKKQKKNGFSQKIHDPPNKKQRVFTQKISQKSSCGRFFVEKVHRFAKVKRVGPQVLFDAL